MVLCVDFPEPGRAVEWRLDAEETGAVGGVDRLERPYTPTWYVMATEGRDLEDLLDAFDDHPAVVEYAFEHHRPGWRREPTRLCRLDVRTHAAIDRLARSVAQTGRPGSYRCFNVDLSPEFRYCLETDTDPTLAREPKTTELAAPPGTTAGDLTRVTVDDEPVRGEPADVAEEVATRVTTRDPDVLRVSAASLVPALFEAATDPEYQLGREPGYEQLAAESTVESYGQVGHSPARYTVPGRVLIDEGNTFFLRETNRHGTRDLVARSWKPLQECAWASIGTILTAIQIREALARDVLVPWRSWRPEFFKSARTLDDADRGGLTFAPDVGVHEDVHELDFASLYPTIMVTRNVSPETVCCDCHPDREDVPKLGYGICPDDGYLPDVLEPIIDDRAALKERLAAATDPDERARLEGQADALKWILVACFGYQGFANAKFGRIECHEAINAIAREILLGAKTAFEDHGWRVVHGIVDSIWVTPMPDREQTPLGTVADRITDATDVRLEYEAAYDWIAFCPRRNDDAGALTRYFGKEAGEPSDDPDAYKVRGIECRQRSTAGYVADTQRELLRTFDRTRSPEAVCGRLARRIGDLRAGRVDPSELAIRNRVSKRLAEYSRTTRNVAALERARGEGLDVHPGQDVTYVITDDAKDGRNRVELAHTDPETYDAGFYHDRLVRAAASVLAPAGWREPAIRSELEDGTALTLDAF